MNSTPHSSIIYLDAEGRGRGSFLSNETGPIVVVRTALVPWLHVWPLWNSVTALNLALLADLAYKLRARKPVRLGVAYSAADL